MGKVPLERALSKLGIASRNKSHQLIVDGKIKINGRIIKDPKYLVTPEKIIVSIEDEPIKKIEKVTYLLNKPKGFITTHSDEKGRPTVFSLIKEDIHLIAVGRLDYASTGLLLLTNDTKLSNVLTDPINKIPRVYIVDVRGEFTEIKKNSILKGIQEGGETLIADKIDILKSSRKESKLKITLCEGKNREIRRIMKTVGNEVTKLKRISFGKLELGNLESGKYRILNEDEIKKLKL